MRVSLINLNFIAQDAIGQCLLHQWRFFRRRGDEVRIYTQHPPEGLPDDVRDGLRDDVQVVSAAGLLAQRDAYFRTSDLYVYHYPGRYDLLETMKGLDRGAVIFFYHNVTPPALWGARTGADDLARGQAGVSKLARYADLVVTVSPFNAEELVCDHGCAPESIRVLPLAVPLDAFHPGPADPALLRAHGLEGKRVILFVGRVAGNKRLDLLVEALPLVRRSVPHARLLVVGDHSSNPAFVEVTSAIRRRAADLGVADDVLFTGRVADLPPYYRLADVYASASLHEGFGVPLIEAMASGVPLVVSDATAHPWVVGDAGLLCAPGDAADLAAQIARVLGDDALAGDLVRRGLARARDFSLEQFNAGWAKIVDEATLWLAEHPYRPAVIATTPTRAGTARPPAAAHDLPLADEVEQLAQRADAVLKPYVVRSNAPLVGPLIAWVRRNLTSHLREPYLDPTLQRQESFNWQVVQTLRQVNRLLHRTQPAAEDTTAAQRAAEIEARTAQLEQRLDAVLDYLAAQVEAARQMDDPAQRAAALDTLAAQIERLRRPATPASPPKPEGG